MAGALFFNGGSDDAASVNGHRTAPSKRAAFDPNTQRWHLAWDLSEF